MNITLKEFKQEDYQDLIKWSVSPEFLLQWAGPIFTHPLTIKQLDNYREVMLQSY